MDQAALQRIGEAIRFLRRNAHIPRKDADRALRMFAQAVGRWGVTDPDLLAATLLHQTIEKNGADYETLAERFGACVADCVSALTRDRRLPLERRERAFAEGMRHAAPELKLIMLLEILDGLQTPGRPRVWLAWKAEQMKVLCQGLPHRYQPLVATIVALFKLHDQFGASAE